jgi:hypothetical protein
MRQDVIARAVLYVGMVTVAVLLLLERPVPMAIAPETPLTSAAADR